MGRISRRSSWRVVMLRVNEDFVIAITVCFDDIYYLVFAINISVIFWFPFILLCFHLLLMALL